MEKQNVSDLIERYIKNILKTEDQIDIRRAEVADKFNCVPSQINYVINTRFTLPNGYLVESKRGGGGYIRIIKITMHDSASALDYIYSTVEQELSFLDAQGLIRQLSEQELVTQRECALMTAVLSPKFFQQAKINNEKEMRAHLMATFLQRLTYEADRSDNNE